MSVTVEAQLSSAYQGRVRDIEPLLRKKLMEGFRSLAKGQIISNSDVLTSLAHDLDRLHVVDTSETSSLDGVHLADARLNVHPYKLSDALPKLIKICTGENDDGPSLLSLELPSQSLAGLWDSLHFDPDIKPKLLKMVNSMLFFTDKGVNLDCVGWNRIILLHGPAGSGKTSLCRALAQKIALRSFMKFDSIVLLEINTRTLLSRWFSESSRMVDALFEWIHHATKDINRFFCVLIDEVESITASRKAATSANEPADSIRVVNSLLTSLDRIKTRRNILILATSNLVEVIDEAFLDRVDLMQHVNVPSISATYHILYSCLAELMRCGIVDGIDDKKQVFDPEYAMAYRLRHIWPNSASSKLVEISVKAQGLSGRALRRIPLLMHSCFQNDSEKLEDALAVMKQVIIEETSNLKPTFSKQGSP